ncbi:Histone-binding N1/N2 [Gossypium arboreum]|uniref:Histone-binding N1/N2 n=1 Tax=Gossypium arboreum TaxID=29729 RepID=A0A0B0MWK8_GOSAR|nr:Histone-binding N1/N2 [Gossypium arboreum]
MAEEEVTTAESEVTVAVTEQTPGKETDGTLETQGSIEATVESAVQGGTESTCNNNNNANGSEPASDVDREKTLEFADELTENGSKAFKENDFAEAADCFSRALEIRVGHHGELAVECLKAYYLYGRALLYKAQEEADPLVSVPKKEGETQQELNKDKSSKTIATRESSVASVSSTTVADGSGKDEEESDDSDSDTDEVAEADEDADESDLDLAWKMLDVARAISEKQQVGDTMEKVDILSSLAEVALEREDIESSLGDYQKALSILQRLVEPDNRQIAELNFRICMCLEIGSKPEEAIPYCQKAISVCKSRLQRLTNEVKTSSDLASSSATSELDDGVQQSSTGSQTLEDLQQLVANPKSIIAEILGMASAKAKADEKSASPAVGSSSRMGTVNSNGGFDSPTVSTAHTNGAAAVTHLGVVGRGVKRVLMSPVESGPAKKPVTEPSSDKADGSSAP